MIEFTAYAPFIKTLKTDYSARLELDLHPYDLPRLIPLNGQGGMFKVTIEPITDEN